MYRRSSRSNLTRTVAASPIWEAAKVVDGSRLAGCPSPKFVSVPPFRLAGQDRTTPSPIRASARSLTTLLRVAFRTTLLPGPQPPSRATIPSDRLGCNQTDQLPAPEGAPQGAVDERTSVLLIHSLEAIPPVSHRRRHCGRPLVHVSHSRSLPRAPNPGPRLQPASSSEPAIGAGLDPRNTTDQPTHYKDTAPIMADFSRQSVDLPTPQRPSTRERSGSMSLGTTPAPAPGSPAAENGGAHPPNGAGPTAATPGSPTTGGPEVSQQVQDVLGSDIGVSTMLNRLKQSVAAAKEFALFLKKRSVLEDEHARGMKKLCRMTQENIHHADHRQGSFAQAYEEMLVIHERMAENGQQFAMSLHQMHDDLLEVAAVAEKHRKGWKQNGLAAEQRLADIESAMRKSKAKYDSLAEDYDRVRTGEARQGGKMFGLKGPKSAAQHEEDLLRKVQAADTDYMGKVQTYQSEKATVVATTRPEAIKALNDLVRECDSATTLQMQKFASFNEKLLLSNGLVISPLKNQSLQTSRSLKEVIQGVDNNKDLEDYLLSFHSKVPPKSSEPKYERNPVLNPQANISTINTSQMPQQQVRPPSQNPTPVQQIPPQQPIGSMSSRQGTFDVSSPGGSQGPGQGYGPPTAMGPPSMGPPQMGASSMGPSSQRPGSQPGHERSFSHGAMLNQASQPSQPPQNQRNSIQALSGPHQRFGNGGSIGQAGPPQLGALPFQSSTNRSPSPPRQNPYQPPDSVRSVSPPSTVAGPVAPAAGGTRPKQVFGLTLDRLYERDGLAVPMVVYQCIQAVDLFGLAVEGIYRLSGSATHIQKLKNMFDTDSDSRNLDFRNPENFFHDVNSVAGLLKQFFRDLPDPLLTSARYSDFIEAAKVEDEIVRRDSMHAIINELPDPNYATLRALTLHLHRVMDNSGVTRMNSQNVAIVFGPTLMGTAPSSNIADSGWQVRVVDTILQNTYQIFDED
ncbi:hypothetical protein JX265_011720 [Neoarthrinium moseri]|uniref:Uncharacterized protein n=1 Tax=Neoarthrinium moseri TaxID=1658444 RepID=A0A9P9WBS3_9PEZI|nr:hypothetical protein JX265_011720 [Neoarthrinium moseri]